MPQTPGHGNDLAKRCREECFGEPEGPGAKIKAQVDEWRGGLKASLWIVALLFAVSVGVSVVAVPALVDARISKRLDDRFGKVNAPTATAPAPASLIPLAHAETKGSP